MKESSVHMEIERKFLVFWDRLPELGAPEYPDVTQVYLATNPVVRVRRTIVRGETYVRLEIKGPGKLARSEFGPYKLPVEDFESLAALSSLPPIEKARYHLPSGNAHPWELDVFRGRNEGLVVVELELAAEDEAFVRPPWLAAEVTDDPRFTNSALAEHPFTAWPAAWRKAVFSGEAPPKPT